MRSTALLFGLFLVACNGDTQDSSASNATTSGPGGGGGSGGAPTSSASTGGMTDGGPQPQCGPSDPGSVLCGGMPCASADNYCCEDTTDGTQTCVPLQVSSCAGLRRQCDEAADCPAGNVCCIPPNQAPFIAYNTMCAPSCLGDPFVYQVCQSDDECENGETCTDQTCVGKCILSCGPLPPERCQ